MEKEKVYVHPEISSLPHSIDNHRHLIRLQYLMFELGHLQRSFGRPVHSAVLPMPTANLLPHHHGPPPKVPTPAAVRAPTSGREGEWRHSSPVDGAVDGGGDTAKNAPHGCAARPAASQSSKQGTTQP